MRSNIVRRSGYRTRSSGPWATPDSFVPPPVPARVSLLHPSSPEPPVSLLDPCVSSSLQIPVARSPPLSLPAALLQPLHAPLDSVVPVSPLERAREKERQREQKRERERKAPSCWRLSRSVAFAICATPHNSVRARDALVFSPCVSTTPHDSTSCVPLP